MIITMGERIAMIPPARTRLDSALLMRLSPLAIQDESVPVLATTPPTSEKAKVSARM